MRNSRLIQELDHLFCPNYRKSYRLIATF